MPILQGTTSGSIMSTAYNIPCVIESFSVYNKTGGAVVVKVGIVVSGSERYMFNINLAAVGTATSSYYESTNIKVPANAEIIIATSGEIDYVVTID